MADTKEEAWNEILEAFARYDESRAMADECLEELVVPACYEANKKFKISQQEIADEVGVSRQRIQQLAAQGEKNKKD